MTSENFEEIFKLINNDIPKENTNLRELILPQRQILGCCNIQDGALCDNS